MATRKHTPELLGTMPYDTPNNEDRNIAYPDGSFVLPFWEQDNTEAEPTIRTALSLPANLVMHLDTQQNYVFKTLTNNRALYNFVIDGQKTKLPVATYKFHALVNGQHSVIKHITIPDSPFSTGSNSDYVSSLDKRDKGGWVLQGEYPINGGETGVEIRFYKPFLRTPNWISASLYDESEDPLAGYAVTISDITAERFQVNFEPAIPEDVDYKLVFAAWA